MERDGGRDQYAAHGGWWPEAIAHHGPGRGGRAHFHYMRDQLIVTDDAVEQVGNELDALEVRVGGMDRGADLGVVLLTLDPETTGDDRDRHVPGLVGRIEARWEAAAGRVAPNHVLGPCTHIHLAASAPEPTSWRAPTVEEVRVQLGAEPLPGDGVEVGLLDTGFEDNAWFAGRVTGDPERAVTDANGQLLPNCGHGTFAAGVVLRHAPGARVIAKRVFDDDGTVNDWMLAFGLVELVDEGADVVNLSIGTFTRRDFGMPAFDRAVDHARSRRPDLVLIAAAGNEGIDRPFYPAADPRVYGVGAVQQDRAGRWSPAPYTNYGASWVNACANGTDVLSAFLRYEGMVMPHHDEAQDGPDDHDEDPAATGCGPAAPDLEKPRILRFDGTARWSGTSFSSPVVAAAVATGAATAGSPLAAMDRLLADPDLPRVPGLGVLVDPVAYG